MTATDAASAGTRDRASSAARAAASDEDAAAKAKAKARTARTRRVNMSEILSGKEPGGERERSETEESGRSVDGEEIHVTASAKCLVSRHVSDRRPAQLRGLGEHPVEPFDELRGPLLRHRGGDLVVCRENGGEEEDRIRRHERDPRRRRDHPDEEGEGEQGRNREQDGQSREEETPMH